MEIIENLNIFEDLDTIHTKLDPPTVVSANYLDYIVLEEDLMVLGRRLRSISSCMCHLQDALHKAGFINFGSGLLDRFAVDQRENYAVAHYKNVMLVQLRLFEIV